MNRLHIDEEIAVMVGCSEHTPLRGQVVRPLMRLDVAAVVVSVSGLEREQSSVSHLRF